MTMLRFRTANYIYAITEDFKKRGSHGNKVNSLVNFYLCSHHLLLLFLLIIYYYFVSSYFSLTLLIIQPFCILTVRFRVYFSIFQRMPYLVVLERRLVKYWWVIKGLLVSHLIRGLSQLPLLFKMQCRSFIF